jgi:hypothetical protein
MPWTLEQRVDAIEKKIAALADSLAKVDKCKTDWRDTVGLSKDDPGFDEMIRLGEKYRKESPGGDDRAHS